MNSGIMATIEVDADEWIALTEQVERLVKENKRLLKRLEQKSGSLYEEFANGEKEIHTSSFSDIAKMSSSPDE